MIDAVYLHKLINTWRCPLQQANLSPQEVLTTGYGFEVACAVLYRFESSRTIASFARRVHMGSGSRLVCSRGLSLGQQPPPLYRKHNVSRLPRSFVGVHNRLAKAARCANRPGGARRSIPGGNCPKGQMSYPGSKLLRGGYRMGVDP